MANYRVLVINPRSNFTKIAVYDNHELVFLNKVMHPKEELAAFNEINDQHDYRKDIVFRELADADIDIQSINVVVGRGGLIKPVKSGVYEINEAMVYDLFHSPFGADQVNFGGLIANDIAKLLNIKAYTCDPVVIDELDDIARISGHPEFERKSVFHALNQKSVAKRFAKAFNKKYEEINLIVAHLGAGISIGAHRKGHVVDVNQGFDGEGPFSPKRSGTLPSGDLIKMCFSGKFSEMEMLKKVSGKGGMTAYFETEDMKEIEKRALNGDNYAKLIYDAMAYQIAKYIGMMYPVLYGNVDAILLTGGIAFSKYFTEQISQRVEKLAPVHIYAGGDEMEALALNVISALEGELPLSEYK